MKLQVIGICLGAESCPHLLHRTHLLDLVDDTLFSEEVEIADYERAKGFRIFLQLTYLFNLIAAVTRLAVSIFFWLLFFLQSDE